MSQHLFLLIEVKPKLVRDGEGRILGSQHLFLLIEVKPAAALTLLSACNGVVQHLFLLIEVKPCHCEVAVDTHPSSQFWRGQHGYSIVG